MAYLTDLKTRVAQVLIEKFTDAGVTEFKAVPIFPWQQERLPYATVRTGSKSRPGDNAEDEIRATRTINIRLIVAHSTEGYDGEAQARLDDYIELVEEAFETNPELITVLEAYEDPPVYLDTRGALLTGDTGLVRYGDGGIDQGKLGVDFTLSVPIEINYEDM